jgi:hypothetical protein
MKWQTLGRDKRSDKGAQKRERLFDSSAQTRESQSIASLGKSVAMSEEGGWSGASHHENSAHDIKRMSQDTGNKTSNSTKQ